MPAPDRKAEGDAPSVIELRTMALKLDAAETRCVELQRVIERQSAELKALKAAPPTTLAPLAEGEERWVLKTALQYHDVLHPIGALVPFDPESPPVGCNGLVEGIHYHKQRVLVAR